MDAVQRLGNSQWGAKYTKLKARIEKLNSALLSIGDGLIITDALGKISFINDAAVKITGWSLEESMGQSVETIFCIIHAKTKNIVPSPFARILQGEPSTGLPKDTVIVTKLGSEFYISAKISPVLEHGKITGAVAVFRDIRRLRLAEEAVLHKQKNLETIFNAAPIGMVIVDQKCIIKQANTYVLEKFLPENKQIFEHALGQVLNCINCSTGPCGSSKACTTCKIRQAVTQAAQCGESTRDMEIRFTVLSNRTPTVRWFRFNAVPFFENDSSYVLLLVSDITEYRQTLEELLAAKEAAEFANQVKSQFLANMSHEIRTPLNGMLGMIDLTINTILTAEQQENLMIAKSCAQSLLNVINDILDFSKLEAGKLVISKVPFNIEQTVKKTVRMYAVKAEEKGVRLECQMPPDLPQVLKGDANRLGQILYNLISNAIKFTEQGVVTVAIRKVTSTAAGLELEFAVSDTGIGLAEEDKPYLFKSFSQVDGSLTRKYGGTGLGLAISKQLVELMGGRIWVESQKGAGSTFYFTIQLAPGGTIVEDAVLCREKKKNEEPLAVLLAEDDKINQRVIQLMLQEKGYILKTVNNGREALEVLANENVDVVIMDIQMPEMDGVEATRQIRQKESGTTEHIPIIAFTAYALAGDRERFLRAGMDGYLAKPVNISELLLTIEKVLENSRIDKILRDLGSAGILAGTGSLQEVEPTFVIEKICLNFARLQEVYQKGDFLLIEQTAHTLKEAAAGEKTIRRLSFRLELAARKSSLAEISELIQLLEGEINNLKKMGELS
ncbi:MAG: response regulator [Pelosinus sp.]|nr:response regulator [Pelosinus sp.]